MSDPEDFHNQNERKFRPAAELDAETQRELDEALSDTSWQDLLEDSASSPRGAASDSGVRHGEVIAIQGDDIFVELGGKSQGVLPAQQFADEPLPAVGEEVAFVVKGFDPRQGLTILTRPNAATEADWETLEQGQIVEGLVTGSNPGGLEMQINSIRAFMPISQIERFHVETTDDYMNQKLTCQVIEADRSRKNLVVSRRVLLEIQAEKKAQELWETLKEGQKLRGVVRSIAPYGAFVDIGGIDGLLHISDMSYSRVENPKDIVHEGQQLDVKVLKVDRETRRVSLGLKQVQPDPWSDAEQKWRVDEVIAGRITRLAEFGAFVELAKGVEGLIPISEISYQRRLRHPGEVLSEGEVVKVRVLKVDAAAKRIGLSLKQMENDPWIGASVRWPEGSFITGRITRLAEFGAFVELAPGMEGLVHISELGPQYVRSVGEVVNEGDAVQAKVLSVEEEARRISLSIKQASAITEVQSPPDIPQPKKTKRNKPLKGGLD